MPLSPFLPPPLSLSLSVCLILSLSLGPHFHINALSVKAVNTCQSRLHPNQSNTAWLVYSNQAFRGAAILSVTLTHCFVSGILHRSTSRGDQPSTNWSQRYFADIFRVQTRKRFQQPCLVRLLPTDFFTPNSPHETFNFTPRQLLMRREVFRFSPIGETKAFFIFFLPFTFLPSLWPVWFLLWFWIVSWRCL